jgi:Fic family protein
VEQSRDAGTRAKRLQDLQAEWHRQVARARASALLARLVDSLFASPVLTIPQAKQLLGVTYVSAQRSVEKLVDAGILQQMGEASYGKSYAAGEILRAITE